MDSHPEPIRIRTATSRDVRAVVELAQADPEGLRLTALAMGDKLRRLRQHCGSGQGHVLVAEAGGRIVGVLHKTDRRGRVAYVEEVYVAEHLRGQRVATMLFLHLLTEMNCQGMEAKNLAVNSGVARLNEKMGLRRARAARGARVHLWKGALAPIEGMEPIDAHINLTPPELFPGDFLTRNKEGSATHFRTANTPSQVIESLDAAGVGRGVLLPFPSRVINAERASTFVWEVARAHPARFRFVPLVSCDVTRWIKRGAAGFKEHSYYMDCTRESHLGAYRKIADAGLILMLHPHLRDKADRVLFTLRKIPGLRILLCHAGRSRTFSGDGVLETARALADQENVTFDTSTIWDAGVIAKLVRIVGADRVLYGSDHPFALVEGTPDRVMARELAFIRMSGLPASQLRQVLSSNCARLFGFPGPTGRPS